jgi:hypothetical protein
MSISQDRMTDTLSSISSSMFMILGQVVSSCNKSWKRVLAPEYNLSVCDWPCAVRYQMLVFGSLWLLPLKPEGRGNTQSEILIYLDLPGTVHQTKTFRRFRNKKPSQTVTEKAGGNSWEALWPCKMSTVQWQITKSFLWMKWVISTISSITAYCKVKILTFG